MSALGIAEIPNLPVLAGTRDRRASEKPLEWQRQWVGHHSLVYKVNNWNHQLVCSTECQGGGAGQIEKPLDNLLPGTLFHIASCDHVMANVYKFTSPSRSILRLIGMIPLISFKTLCQKNTQYDTGKKHLPRVSSYSAGYTILILWFIIRNIVFVFHPFPGRDPKPWCFFHIHIFFLVKSQ